MNLPKKSRTGTPRNPNRASLGCAYVLGIGVVCILLLVVNGLMVRGFLVANSSANSELQVEQAIQYFVPVALIFLEFWIWDLVAGRD